tara:strand:- start:6913 stop:7602 length:690 start_codon:yes stop_codon:yes gene_type:complete
MKKRINHHVGVTVVRNGDNFLFQVYDDTLPKVINRGKVNLLGGNYSPGDQSPEGILRRELEEEFSTNQPDSEEFERAYTDILGKGPGAKRVKTFAPEEDISFIRGCLLNCIKPWNDILLTVLPYEDKPLHSVICSVFEATIPQEVLECARRNIDADKAIRNEGLSTVATLQELVTGKVLAATATAPIMQVYLGQELPNPENATARIIGKPRQSLRDYLPEYTYKVSIED